MLDSAQKHPPAWLMNRLCTKIQTKKCKMQKTYEKTENEIFSDVPD